MRKHNSLPAGDQSPTSQPAPKTVDSAAMPQYRSGGGMTSGGNSGLQHFDSADYLISPKELAEMLDVSPRTIWRWLSCGRIPKPIHIGGARRWWRSEIILCLNSLQAKKGGA